MEDFLAKRPSTGPGRVIPSYRPGVTWTNLWDCLPDFVAASIAEALPILGRKLKGYDQPDAVLTAVESRSSSPVRLLRDEDRQSPSGACIPAARAAAGQAASSPPPRTVCAARRRSVSNCKPQP
ncbi:MAG: FAD-dependent protein [Dysosmobacter sp.]